jgi:hypothetical protein
VRRQTIEVTPWPGNVAVAQWMDATGTVVDACPDEEVWTEERLDQDRASFEVRVSPIFE